jgi:hypothetical protein
MAAGFFELDLPNSDDNIVTIAASRSIRVFCILAAASSIK